MKENILDSQEVEQKKRKKKEHPFIGIIPLIFLWGLIIFSSPLGIAFDHPLAKESVLGKSFLADLQYIFALTFLIVTTITYYIYRPAGVILLGGIIFLGIFSIVSFSYYSLIIPNIPFLKIEVLILLISIIYFRVHRVVLYKVYNYLMNA